MSGPRATSRAVIAERTAASQTRRDFLRSAAVVTAATLADVRTPAHASTLSTPARVHMLGRRSAPHIIVVGAGAFGGWTALSLLRKGARVTLVDAWGAGNSRSSSGDETRIIRSMYAGNVPYTRMATRALHLWKDAERQWGRRVFHRTGALYLFEGDDAPATTSVPVMRAMQIPIDELTLAEARRRWPQIRFDGVKSVYFEPDAGYLLSRASCEMVRESFVAEGGAYRLAAAKPGRVVSGKMQGAVLDDGSLLEGDAYVFACGPWLGQLFPSLIGPGIEATRQDVIYLGVAPGESPFAESRFPVWVNFGERVTYGIPGNDRRGFKVADDTAGSPLDPTTASRIISEDALRIARDIVARRFPGLVNAPVVETRVCQYEYSPDGDFLLDRHPGAANTWIIGGGSGHGFKMGPALGEYVTGLVMDDGTPDAQFAWEHFATGLARLKANGGRGVHK
ncbi:MAG: FAD-dependent oxidoreductase [Gemmatimonadaceae bacterium]